MKKTRKQLIQERSYKEQQKNNFSTITLEENKIPDLLIKEDNTFQDINELLKLNKLKKEKERIKQLQKLEEQPLYNFTEIHNLSPNEHYPIENPKCFLYHGICHGNQFEKLENIFKEKKILAGNHLPYSYYIPYDDNANKGNYVSLLKYDSREDITYKIFIMPNITLIIKPINTAFQTIYVSYETWLEIQKFLPTHKNRYSYARNEYQVKDFISLEDIVAIGIPYHYLNWTNQKHLANEYQEKVSELLKKYQLSLPIVDTSWRNNILVPVQEHTTKKLVKRKT